MVKPVSPDEPSSAYSYQKTHEREKMVELEWEMAVLGAFLAATEKNGDLKKSASQIENQKSHGIPADTLGNEVNKLIVGINKETKKEAPFPHFYFSDQSKTLVLESYLRTFEAYYTALHGKVDLNSFERSPYAKDLQALFSSNISISNPQAIFAKMDMLIETLNRYLPSKFTLPKLPPNLVRG